MRTVSLTALRRIAIGAQGYAGRSRAGTRSEVEEAIRRLSCVQLDSISAVERSHRIALSSRVGAYRTGTVPRLLRRGRVFEYWAHEACLLPVEEWPLFVPQMRDGGRRWYGDVGQTHPHLADEILANAKQWDLEPFAPTLASHPLLVITSDDGLAPTDNALAAAVAAQPGAKVTKLHLATDHGYDDQRITLATALIRWLETLPGGPVSARS